LVCLFPARCGAYSAAVATLWRALIVWERQEEKDRSKGLSFFSVGGDGAVVEQREYDENALGTEWTPKCVHHYERLVWA
jgi:hypothetical protein